MDQRRFDDRSPPLARPWIDETEVEAAAKVARCGWLCQCARTEQFEAEMAPRVGAKRAIAVSTPRTKVILPVHYAGQFADMEPLLDIARRPASPCSRTRPKPTWCGYRGGRFAGTIGEIGIYSFTPTKLVTTGEGRMIVTDDHALAKKCRLIRQLRRRWQVPLGHSGLQLPLERGGLGARPLPTCQARPHPGRAPPQGQALRPGLRRERAGRGAVAAGARGLQLPGVHRVTA